MESVRPIIELKDGNKIFTLRFITLRKIRSFAVTRRFVPCQNTQFKIFSRMTYFKLMWWNFPQSGSIISKTFLALYGTILTAG